MKLNKAYKLRLYPDEGQKQFFEQNFGNARFIYNKMLGDKIEHYTKTKDMLYNTPAQYKEEYEFLKLSDSLALSNAQMDLQASYRNFFKNPKHFGFPKFKSKHKSKFSYKTNNQSTKGKDTIYIQDSRIKLPKVGFIRVVKDREFVKDCKIKSVTVSRTRTDKYFASILVEYHKEIIEVEPETFLGLDFSMSDLYVDSEYRKPKNPKAYRNNQQKLAFEQRKLSRMVRGSKNYKKQKIKVAKVHEKIANIRKDFLHKESRKITNSYDVVCIESLNMSAMSRCLNFGKSVHDNGWRMFVEMLNYKLFEEGKHLIKADKWFPSTKTCSYCGERKEKITLSERVYKCEHCGVQIDRDYNASLNLKKYAVEQLTRV